MEAHDRLANLGNLTVSHDKNNRVITFEPVIYIKGYIRGTIRVVRCKSPWAGGATLSLLVQQSPAGDREVPRTRQCDAPVYHALICNNGHQCSQGFSNDRALVVQTVCTNVQQCLTMGTKICIVQGCNRGQFTEHWCTSTIWWECTPVCKSSAPQCVKIFTSV